MLGQLCWLGPLAGLGNGWSAVSAWLDWLGWLNRLGWVTALPEGYQPRSRGVFPHILKSCWTSVATPSMATGCATSDTSVCRVITLTCSRLSSQDSKLRGNGLRKTKLSVQRGHGSLKLSLNGRYAVASILLVGGGFRCGGGLFYTGFCGGVFSHPRLRVYYCRAIWHSKILRWPR